MLWIPTPHPQALQYLSESPMMEIFLDPRSNCKMWSYYVSIMLYQYI